MSLVIVDGLQGASKPGIEHSRELIAFEGTYWLETMCVSPGMEVEYVERVMKLGVPNGMQLVHDVIWRRQVMNLKFPKIVMEIETKEMP